MTTEEILKQYQTNLKHSISGRKYVSDRYNFQDIKSSEVNEIAKSIIDFTKKFKKEFKELEDQKAECLHLDRIKGEVRYIRPYAITKLICLQNKIKHNSDLPQDFFIKDNTLYMVNTVAFNVAQGTNAPLGCHTDFERVLYALSIFESLEVKNLAFLKTKDYDVSLECLGFIYELNKNYGRDFITVQELNVIEKDFDDKIFSLIEKLTPEWKSGKIKTIESANINLKNNLDSFKHIETVMIQGKIKFTHTCCGIAGSTDIITPPETQENNNLKCPNCSNKMVLRRGIGFSNSGTHTFTAYCSNCDEEVQFSDSELWKACLDIALNKEG